MPAALTKSDKIDYNPTMKALKIPLPNRGIDLLTGDVGLPAGTVRKADNVDIRADGSFRRRAGYDIAVAGADFHSLHKAPRGVLVGRGDKVYALDLETFAPTALCAMGSTEPVEFTEFNGHTYFINPASFWWIPADDTAPRRVGVREPASLPDLVAHPNGTLLPGEYAVGLSRLDERGEESRTVLVGQVTLTGTGGIQLTGLPQDLMSSYRVYLTPPGGEVLYLSEQFSGAFSQFVVTRMPDGAQRTTQHLRPMPPGDFVRAHGGRLYVAAGDRVWFSEALRPHMHDPRHNFIQFVGRISFIEAVAGGLFVGDERGVWFLSGKDPEQFQMQLVSSPTAVRRSSLVLSGAHFDKRLTETDLDVAIWLSTEGYMLGRPSGDVFSFHPERVRVAAGLEGRSRFVVRDGVKQVITLVAATTASGYGVAIDTTLQ